MVERSLDLCAAGCAANESLSEPESTCAIGINCDSKVCQLLDAVTYFELIALAGDAIRNPVIERAIG